jgi:hypothetical protein
MIRLLLVAALVVGCEDGPGNDAQQPRIDDAEAALRAVNRAIGFSTAFLGIGVVDTRADESTIALAIYQHFKAQTGNCAMATPTTNQVSVDLGMGCTLANASFIAGGTAEATVVKPSPMPLNIEFALNLSVDTQTLTGTLDANTENGDSWTYGIDASMSGASARLPFFTAGIASGGTQIGGSGTFTGRATSMVDLTGLHQRFDGCYPDEGTLRMRDGGVDLLITFAGTTPRTGQVTLRQNGADRTVTLPARNNCPR